MSITRYQRSVISQHMVGGLELIIAIIYCDHSIVPVTVKPSISIFHWYSSFDPSIATMSWQKYCATFLFLEPLDPAFLCCCFDELHFLFNDHWNIIETLSVLVNIHQIINLLSGWLEYVTSLSGELWLFPFTLRPL